MRVTLLHEWTGYCPLCEANTLVALVLPGDPVHDCVECTTCPWWTVLAKDFWKEDGVPRTGTCLYTRWPVEGQTPCEGPVDFYPSGERCAAHKPGEEKK